MRYDNLEERYVVYYRHREPDGNITPWYREAEFDTEEKAAEYARRHAGTEYMSGSVSEERVERHVIVRQILEEFK